MSRSEGAIYHYLWVNQLHDGLFKIIEVHSILSGGSRYYVVFVVIIATHGCKLLAIRKLDIYTVFLHNSLNASTANTNDPFVVRLGDMERYLRRQLLLE